jgi:peptide/nickel transport system substrate-binding protein
VEVPKEFTAPEALIGTGPYRLTDYSKEHNTYRFEANPDFWGPAQRVKAIEFVPVSEAILAFMQGEVDLIGLTPDLLPRFQKDPEYRVVQAPAFWGYRLLFNMQDHAVFQQRDVRQAIQYAIDKEELIEKIARGAAVPGSPGVLPVDHILYNPAVAYQGSDLDRARQLLDQTGFNAVDDSNVRRNDAGEELAFTFLVGGGAEVRIGEVLKEQLARVGIQLTVRSVDSKTRDTKVRENDYQLALLGHGGWGGDADYLRERFGDQPKGGLSPSASRLHGYENAELLALLNQQYTTIDEAQRKALIFTIQEMLADEVLEIPLYNTTSYSVYRPDKYDGWMFMFDHHSLTHSKLSYLGQLQE